MKKLLLLVFFAFLFTGLYPQGTTTFLGGGLGGGVGSTTNDIFGINVRIISAGPFDASIGDIIWADATGGDFTINLPPVVNNVNAQITVKKINILNTVTIDAFGSETIDDSLVFNLTGVDESLTIISNGIQWRVISHVFNGIKRKAVADADYQLKNSDRLVVFTSLTTSRVATLPVPDGEFRLFIIKDESLKASLFPIIVTTPGSETIEMVDTMEITTDGGSFIFYSDGSNYRLEGGIPNSGQVKINTGNSVQPQIVITAPTTGVFQDVQYASPLGISSYPTTKWPQNINTPVDSNIYNSTEETFIENLIPGQINNWRFIFAYSGKSGGQITGVTFKMFNDLSAFIFEDVRTIPSENTAGEIAFDFFTIADGASLHPPFGTGHGYKVQIKADDPITFDLISTTRNNPKAE